MRQKVLTLVLAAMVASCSALPHHPFYIAGFPPRHVSYLPYYGNMGRVSVLSVPQYGSPGQLIVVPPSAPGVSYVPLVADKPAALSSDHVNFCKVVGNSLASSPPSSLEIEEPLTIQPIQPFPVGDSGSLAGSQLKSPWSQDVPRRRQSVGPINLNYMCKRISRFPIPGQFLVPTMVRYCKRLAHTISSNSPFLFRQLPVTSPAVPEIVFSGLSQHPLRASPTEANRIATLCQTMLQEIVTKLDNFDDQLETDEDQDDVKSVEETKASPSPTVEESITEEATEPTETTEPEQEVAQSTAAPTSTDTPALPGIKVVIKDKVPSNVGQLVLVSPAHVGLVQPSTYLLHHGHPHTIQQIILHQTNA